jgi:hypothetical protein
VPRVQLRAEEAGGDQGHHDDDDQDDRQRIANAEASHFRRPQVLLGQWSEHVPRRPALTTLVVSRLVRRALVIALSYHLGPGNYQDAGSAGTAVRISLRDVRDVKAWVTGVSTAPETGRKSEDHVLSGVVLPRPALGRRRGHQTRTGSAHVETWRFHARAGGEPAQPSWALNVELPGIEPASLRGNMPSELPVRSISVRFNPSRYLRFRSRVLTASRAVITHVSSRGTCYDPQGLSPKPARTAAGTALYPGRGDSTRSLGD